MNQCPFCQFENENGAIFCEQCKSDLSGDQTQRSVAGASAAPIAALVDDVQVYGDHELANSAAEDDSPFQFLGTVAPEPALAPAFAMPSKVTPPPIGTPIVSAADSAARGEANRPASGTLPAEARPKLVVVRGRKVNVEYALFPGHNFIGRTDDKPVDIDLEEQEPPDRIWSSRQHAVVTFENNRLIIEDLNSSNGTFVNRVKIYPGRRRSLEIGDLIQIGSVQLKVQA